MKKLKNILLLLGVAVVASLNLIGCDDGGGGGDQGGQSTTVNGKVSNIIAMKADGDETIKFAELMELLNFIEEAKAQSGITVSALIDGEVVSTDTTDPDGSFSLTFMLESDQEVTLNFGIDGTTVSVTIFVEQGSILDIIVVIDLSAPPGDEVDVVEEIHDPIICETGNLDITKTIDEDIVIDGGGEACIMTMGNCNLTIDPENIILTNCDECIDARGTSKVTLTSPDGHIACDATGDGIQTSGDANVMLNASGKIDILAGENGVEAVGNSIVAFTADTCVFESGDDPFNEVGNATIDTSGCGEVIVGPSPTPGPTPSPPPSPTPTSTP
ncbi:MAG: hypothetical protein AB1598_07095 [Thermodesulfobacteriota bacterium]